MARRIPQLAGEHVAQPEAKPLARLPDRLSRHEVQARFTVPDGGEQFQNVYHRVVVVGDGVMVAAGERVDLRPATVGILRIKNIGQAAEKARAPGREPRRGGGCSPGRVTDAREEEELGDRGIVVVGAAAVLVVFIVGRAGIARVVAALGPGPDRCLPGDDVVGERPCLLGGIPGVRGFEIELGAVNGGDRRAAQGAAGGEFPAFPRGK